MTLFGKLKNKNLHTWLSGYARHCLRSRPRQTDSRHLLFALCDHFEPLWGSASDENGDARVRTWQERYPKMVAPFRDADGKPPRHSFFFPGEQYRPSTLDRLAQLTKQGFGEVELHLHHDQDNAKSLRANIENYLAAYARHGHLSRDADGRPRYGFIHGNWCLSNARKDRRHCGVDEEIPLLFETGCYADFTFPSAPDECQPNIVNQIYWPQGDLKQRRAYEQGRRARVGEFLHDRVLLMQGPLSLTRRPGKLWPRIEAAAITAADPATSRRVQNWIDASIHVDGRPEWIFVKVHTHGAPEAQAASLLGDSGQALHRALRQVSESEHASLHYVTAREMYNIAVAAMEGKTGNPNDFRDHLLKPPPCFDGRSA